MFIINESFRVDQDKYNWILIETYEGLDKDKNPKMQEDKTFYPTLEKLLISVLDKSIEGDTVENILDSIHRAKLAIKTAVLDRVEQGVS
jgi:hypothetical protein